MGLIGTIVIGFLAGLVARFLHPGQDPGGFIITPLLGIVGAIVALVAVIVLGSTFGSF